ncbi:MAG: hypothetical protein ABFD91_03980 [Anaerohalosphaeraceae bacterium]
MVFKVINFALFVDAPLTLYSLTHSRLLSYSKEESAVRWGDAGEKERELWSRDKKKKPHFRD